MKVIKKVSFWKRFLKYMAVGLSCMVLLYFFQARPAVLFAQSSECPAAPTSLTPASGTQLPAGTRSVTISWNGGGATNFSVLFSGTGGTLFQNSDYPATSATVNGLQDGGSYSWSVRPYGSSCGYGDTSSTTLSVAGPLSQTGGGQTCSNEPVWCPNPNVDESGGMWVHPDPKNNCQTVCPGQTSVNGAPICNSLTANPSSGNSPLNVSFTANAYSPSNRTLSYQWDLGDGNPGHVFYVNSPHINNTYTNYGSSNSTFYPRVHIFDSQGLSTDCSTTVTVFGTNTSSCSTDRITCSDGSTVGRDPNNSCQFFACPNNGTNNQCRSINCPMAQLVPGCYYSVPLLTYSCDVNAQLTCGQITCNTNNVQPITNPITNPSFPSIPNPFGGNSQNTWVGISNANNNENNNLNSSDSFSSSWASGGSGGSSNITINW